MQAIQNNPYIEEKLLAIQENLVSYIKSGKSNQVKGNEREKIVSTFLQSLLPPQYRIGQGEITDHFDSISEHVDIVVELPFGFRIQMPSSEQSLYTSETVGAVIEVKSNLSSQWSQVEKKVLDLKKIKRIIYGHQSVIPPFSISHENIGDALPVYVIALKGYDLLELQQKMASTAEDRRPHGILVVETGAFLGLRYKMDGVWGLYYFISEILMHLRTITTMQSNPFAYCTENWGMHNR